MIQILRDRNRNRKFSFPRSLNYELRITNYEFKPSIQINIKEKLMWVADNWKDYELIDTSDGERLERWGKYILVRPDPQIIWRWTVFPPFTERPLRWKMTV